MQIDSTLYSWQTILNPNALVNRRKKLWEDIERKLQAIPIHYLHHVTSTIAEAKDLIIDLCKRGERHFIVIGGDGTLNIFINAVMESQVNSAEIYVALIPLGTGNDWSRSHGYSTNYLDAIDALKRGTFMNHDVGLVETFINDKRINARYFINIAGFGFDGAVIYNTTKKSTKVFRKQMYLINLLKTLLAYKSQPVTLKTTDFTTTKNIFSIAAGIGQYNGNGMRQCPEAISNDGLLEVVMIEKVSIRKVLQNISNLFKGLHVKKLKEVTTNRTDYLEINTSPHILGEVEGEVLTTGNYRIRCYPSAINFMYVEG